MVNIFKTAQCGLNKLDHFEDGVWIQMVNQTSKELNHVAEEYEIEIGDLATALDEEESSRITLRMDIHWFWSIFHRRRFVMRRRCTQQFLLVS